MPNFAKDDVYVKPTPSKAYLPYVANNQPAQAGPQQGNVWTQAVDRTSGRPQGLYPPQTSGPIVNPQGVARDRVAQAYSLSDKARGVLSRTPIGWNTDNEANYYGLYRPDVKDITLNTWDWMTSHKDMLDVLAHELTHRWQDDQTPGFKSPSYQQGLINDIHSLAQANPSIRNAVNDWDIGNYATYRPDQLDMNASELGARVAQMAGPQNMPADFRNKYYPGMYQTTFNRSPSQPFTPWEVWQPDQGNRSNAYGPWR